MERVKRYLFVSRSLLFSVLDMLFLRCSVAHRNHVWVRKIWAFEGKFKNTLCFAPWFEFNSCQLKPKRHCFIWITKFLTRSVWTLNPFWQLKVWIRFEFDWNVYYPFTVVVILDRLLDFWGALKILGQVTPSPPLAEFPSGVLGTGSRLSIVSATIPRTKG